MNIKERLEQVNTDIAALQAEKEKLEERQREENKYGKGSIVTDKEYNRRFRIIYDFNNSNFIAIFEEGENCEYETVWKIKPISSPGGYNKISFNQIEEMFSNTDYEINK